MGSSKVAVYSDFKNTTLSALELQSIGQQYYGQRDYVNALGAFTAVSHQSATAPYKLAI